jgi:hypothetical protein
MRTERSNDFERGRAASYKSCEALDGAADSIPRIFGLGTLQRFDNRIELPGKAGCITLRGS